MIKLIQKKTGTKVVHFRNVVLPKGIEIYDVDDGTNLFQSDLSKEYYCLYLYWKATEHKHQLITKGIPSEANINEAIEKFQEYLKEFYGEEKEEQPN